MTIHRIKQSQMHSLVRSINKSVKRSRHHQSKRQSKRRSKRHSRRHQSKRQSKCRSRRRQSKRHSRRRQSKRRSKQLQRRSRNLKYNDDQEHDIMSSYIDPQLFVSGLQSLWSDLTSTSGNGDTYNSSSITTKIKDDDYGKSTSVLSDDDFETLLAEMEAHEQHEKNTADEFHDRQIEEAIREMQHKTKQIVVPAAKAKGAIQPKTLSSKKGVGTSTLPTPSPASKKGVDGSIAGSIAPSGKKAKKKPGEQSIDWGKLFSICNLLSTAQLSKYNQKTQLMIGQLPAMSNPLTKNALNTYLTNQKETTLLEYMSKFSQKYPAYYLKLIIESIPSINYPYIYIPWLGTHNIFEGVNENDALISSESCFEHDPKKTELIKQNKLTNSYSPYILSVLFDVIARYRFCYGAESPKILDLMTKQDTVESQYQSFSESENKLSCPSYTSILLDILEKNPSCRDKDADEFKECPYESGSLDTIRKLIYQCMNNIQTVQSSLSKTEQDNINKQILTNMISEGLMSQDGTPIELTEVQELRKNQIIFNSYSLYLGELLQMFTNPVGIVKSENNKMLGELPGKKPNEILLLSLLLRALQNGNSDFIEDLSSKELMIVDSNIVFKGNDGKQSSELQIVKHTKDLLSKYIPKNCTGTNVTKSICVDYKEVEKLKPMLLQKPPVPGSKHITKSIQSTTPAVAKKGPVKKIALSDQFTQQVMNNFAIQTAKVPLQKVSYIL